MSSSINNLLNNDTHQFYGIRLAGKPSNTLWDVACTKGYIASIIPHKSSEGDRIDGRLLTPSLCHPHIHLDKCFLLSHPKYADLEIQEGDFAEAMKLTSKSRFLRAYSVGHNLLYFAQNA